MQIKCKCSDPGCLVHAGSSSCSKTAEYVIKRVDMADETGTAMCNDCSADALESGVFRVDEDLEEDEDDNDDENESEAK